jgi:hypothetical protein
VRGIEPGSQQCVERRIDTRLVLRAPPGERRDRVDLASDEAVPVLHLAIDVGDRLVECVGDGGSRIGRDEEGSMTGTRRRERQRTRNRGLPHAALSADDEHWRQ